MIRKRFNYLKRIYQAYFSGEESQLTFWHGTPTVNQAFEPGLLGEYYMPFLAKAAYKARLDEKGIPLLDYHGTIGVQYNPIAIAQYGLGNYNLFQRNGEELYQTKFIQAADWLRDNLVENQSGVPVWMHNFDFEYQEVLRSPWYSGLAQGQGVSALVRAYQITQDESYLKAAQKAFIAFGLPVTDGGVIVRDQDGNLWIEEYLVTHPTHILNGFIWSLWGVYDYYLLTNDDYANKIFNEGVKTLRSNLHRYDNGYWSLYDLSTLGLQMIASRFYHQLHIVQLEIMYKLTKEEVFLIYEDKWKSYYRKATNRWRALIHKGLFKFFYH